MKLAPGSIDLAKPYETYTHTGRPETGAEKTKKPKKAQKNKRKRVKGGTEVLSPTLVDLPERYICVCVCVCVCVCARACACTCVCGRSALARAHTHTYTHAHPYAV